MSQGTEVPCLVCDLGPYEALFPLLSFIEVVRYSQKEMVPSKELPFATGTMLWHTKKILLLDFSQGLYAADPALALILMIPLSTGTMMAAVRVHKRPQMMRIQEGSYRCSKGEGVEEKPAWFLKVQPGDFVTPCLATWATLESYNCLYSTLNKIKSFR